MSSSDYNVGMGATKTLLTAEEFDNYPFEEAIDLSIGLYNWMIDARTQECLSILRGGDHDREDDTGVITYYEQEIEFFRERISELEEARNEDLRLGAGIKEPNGFCGGNSFGEENP